jgi:hypothetical protein
MEVKLDALAEALKDLVVVQRDMHHVLDRIHRQEQRQDRMEEKLNRVATNETSSSTSSATFERLALVVFSALVAVLGTLIFNTSSPL